MTPAKGQLLPNKDGRKRKMLKSS